LINALSGARSSEATKAVSLALVNVADITEDERDALWRACAENPCVAGVGGVTDAIYARFGAPPAPEPAVSHDDIPF
jgi:hypothetical protein